jgi:hypothetical protein
MNKEFRIEYVVGDVKLHDVLYLESLNEDAVRLYAESEIELKHAVRKGQYEIIKIQEVN